MSRQPRYAEIPIRVFMEDGTVHLIRRVSLSVAIAELPDAVRVERADKRQPPQIVEDSTDG
jgi:hypothetical protein